MAHLLVSGGAGYIGSHAVRALRRAGHSVVIIDDLRGGEPCLDPDVPLIRRDVGDRDGVRRLFTTHGPFDGILHFAAYLSVPGSVAQPLDYYENNVDMTLTTPKFPCVEHWNPIRNAPIMLGSDSTAH